MSVPDQPAPADFAPARSPWPWARLAPLAYLAALTLAEWFTTLSAPPLGLALHGLLLLALMAHAALSPQRAQQRFLLALTLAPLIRLLSLSLPLPNFPFVYWYALVGAPLFLAAFAAARVAGYSAASLGLRWRWQDLPLQLAVGLTGLLFGWVEYQILRPAELIPALTWRQFLLPALVLAVFTGLLEEVVFRGLMQRAAQARLGRWGVLYVAIVFAVLHLGYQSMLDVAFVLGVGLFFGLVVARTRSLLGVTLSHSLTNIMLFLVVPFFAT
jgi:membrane protease YdiL (CAAX protease family)